MHNRLVVLLVCAAQFRRHGAFIIQVSKEYFRLKDDMTQEEIDVVTAHLKKNSLIRYEELFGV
mgnify:CR=1 FL=1